MIYRIYIREKNILLRLLILIILFVLPSYVYSQEKYTLNGYVSDSESGESLIGATVFINEIKGGTITNPYGFYSITLEQGSYRIDFRYVGYQSITKEIQLDKNQKLDIELLSLDVELETVTISDRAEDFNISSIEMSTNKLDMSKISEIPTFLGENDIIKAIQLLPGVSSVGEGASGFNVRGGSVGQNLVLLDEAPVYNSSHLLGFLSVFNPDAVKDLKLYKGGIPSRYGGRLSSILDIRMKDGNNKKKVMMASLDVYRPAAQEQLKSLGEQNNILTLPIIEGQLPADICRRAISAANLNGAEIILFDTAGRTQIDLQMMSEIKQIESIINPTENFLVADSLTGQVAAEVAKEFKNTVNLTGIILTRADGDARGGAAVSMKYVSEVPIKFLGVGEKIDNLEVFHPDRIANRILGMGDVVSLVEKAQEEFSEDDLNKETEEELLDIPTFLRRQAN